MKFPADLKYTAHDEWARVEDGVLTLGITDFAQDALGDLVHVELPKVGARFKAGDAVCEVESVKAVASVYSPVDGEVVEVNGALDGSEETINQDPYGDGWLVRLKVNDAAGLSSLLDLAAYQAKLAK